MERFNGLGRGAQLMLIGGVLLFIDMFFAWQKVDLGPLGDYTRKGWYGAAGVILGILTIILLAWLIVRLASVNIPLPVSSAMSAAVIGVLILIFAIIKLISILGDAQTFWAWLGVAFAVVIVVGAFMAVQEAGGSTRSEARRVASGRRCRRRPQRPLPRRNPRRRPTAAGSGPGPGADERSPARSCGLRHDGCGLGRNERRAVDRAGHVDPLDTHFAAVPGRAAARRAS